MNDVAEAAGVTKPVLYQHFRSKRDLYREVLTDVGAHLLDEITKALPAYTWLTDLGVSAPAAGSGAGQNRPAGAKADSVPAGPPPPLTFQINGRTIDIQAYTRFLRQLEASPWIMDVMPVSAMTVVEKERPVTAFIIRASYNRADSAYIRTAPFSQSVR
jgi:AcrR family transcriptional regulator